MGYRQAVPYLLRYMVALMAWLVVAAADILVRAALLPLLPILWLRSWQSQPDAQTVASTADFIYRPLLRFPRPHLLLRRHKAARSGTVAIK